MRIYLVVFVILFSIVSCEQSRSSDADKVEDLLENGKWVVESMDVPLKRVKSGIKFSQDKQVFYIDSQGRIIPTHKKSVYEVKGDTLRIVDFKYEPRFLFEKGTLIALIKHLDNESIELDILHPEENKLILKKQKL